MHGVSVSGKFSLACESRQVPRDVEREVVIERQVAREVEREVKCITSALILLLTACHMATRFLHSGVGSFCR